MLFIRYFNILTAWFFLVVLLHYPESGYAQQNATNQRILKVSLYPYLPNAADLYWKLESAFEKRFPEIELEISFAPNYYKVEEDGIFHQEADLYELDCVFLRDFIAAGKIQPLPSSLVLDEKEFLPMSKVGFQDNRWYGYPHWLCTNFLYYRKSNAAMQRVQTFDDLLLAIPKNPGLQKGLLIDMTGSSTLGELYLDALVDEYRTLERALPYLTAATPPKGILTKFNTLLDRAHSNYGRVDNYHDRAGFYARQFARGNGAAYVGYSEQTYYMFQEVLQSCTLDQTCLREDEIEVKQFPLSNQSPQPIGWVDMFVVDAKVDETKMKDVVNFIQFMTADSNYLKVLIPNWDEKSRYLLPPKYSVYQDKELKEKAPLYKQFLPIIEKTFAVTNKDLNRQLKAMGEKVSSLLKEPVQK